jgi:hypothetical protein
LGSDPFPVANLSGIIEPRGKPRVLREAGDELKT